MAAHFHYAMFYILDFGSEKACIPGLFSKVMVPSGTRMFPVGNPYLFLKEG